MGNIFQKQQPIICPSPPPCPSCPPCEDCPDCQECDSSSDSVLTEDILKTFVLKHGDEMRKLDPTNVGTNNLKLLNFNTLSDEDKQKQIDNLNLFVKEKGGKEVILADGLAFHFIQKTKEMNKIARAEIVDARISEGSPQIKNLSSKECREISIPTSIILKPAVLIRKNACYSQKDGEIDGEILGRQCPKQEKFTEPAPTGFAAVLGMNSWKQRKAVHDFNELEKRLRCIDAKFDEYNDNATIQNVNNIQTETVNVIEPFVDNNENYDLFIYILIIITLVYIFCKK